MTETVTEYHWRDDKYECVAIVGQRMRWREMNPQTGQSARSWTEGAIVLGVDEESRHIFLDPAEAGFWNPVIQCGESFHMGKGSGPSLPDDQDSE